MTTTTIASSDRRTGVDADFLRQTLQHALQRLMEMGIEALCKAAYGERSEERINSRNGFRDRAYETRVGRNQRKRPASTGEALPINCDKSFQSSPA